MEVHHHSHTAVPDSHRGKKKWTHYFWEFFMLFLAVTLGFFVENKREHFIEHKRAKQYALLLKLDLINDTMRLSDLMSNKYDIKNFTHSVINFYATPTDKVSCRDYYGLKSKDVTIIVFEPQNATYTQLQHSGNLRYFTNPEIVLQLAFYDLAVKKYQTLWNDFKTAYGGLNSEHILQQSIMSDKFLKEHPMDSCASLLKDLGYNFRSWEEAGVIKSNILNGINFLNTEMYPSLMKSATDLIEMLDNEYHLK